MRRNTLLMLHGACAGVNSNVQQHDQDSADIVECLLCREEKIRKLEQQLRNAYGSMGRAALRASGSTAPDGMGSSVRISRIGLAAAQAPVGQSLDETLEVRATVHTH